MKGLGRPARLVAVAVLAGALGLAFWQSRSLERKARLGRHAPAFTLAALDGKTVSLPELLDRPVLLNFWASWCAPCRDEAPALETFHERYGDQVRTVGIDVREPVDTVDAFAQRFGLRYPLLLDRSGSVSDAYGTTGLPESWLIDADGVLRFFWRGPMTFEVMQRAAEEVLGRPLDGGAPLGGVLAARAAPRLVTLWCGGLLESCGSSRGGFFRRVGPGAWAPFAGLPWESGSPTALAGDGVRGAVAVGGRVWVQGAGRAWHALPAGPGSAIGALAFSAPAGELYAWVVGEGLWRFGEGRWERLGPGPDAELVAPALAVDSDTIYLGTHAGLSVSRDGGRTFQETGFTRPVEAIAVLPGAAEAGEEAPRLWVASRSGLYGGNAAETIERLSGAPARWLDGVAVSAGTADGAAVIAPNGDIYLYSPAAGWSLHPIEAAGWDRGERGSGGDEL